jgi:type I restriction enzyme, S subunit
MGKSTMGLPSSWRSARFDEILRRIERRVTLDDGALYSCVGVRWYGLGAFERETLLGMNIARKQQWIIRAGDVVYNKLFAWKGSFAIADKSIDGQIVSDKFPTYELELTAVEPRYLQYYFRTPRLAQQAQDLSKGAAAISKLTLNPPQFWDLTIPLPPLDEQRRIVARIEELAVKIEEARGLRREAIRESSTLLSAEASRVVANAATRFEVRSFGSYNPHVTSGPRYWNSRYSNTGFRFYRAQDIGSNGEMLNGSRAYVVPPDSEQGQTALLAAGDLMLVITGATVGRCTVFSDDLEPGFVSQHVAICRLPSAEVLPAFALWCLRATQGQTQLLGQRYGQGKPGLNLSNIRALKLPVPPLLEQRRIIAYLDDLQARVDALKRLQTETADELDALLPSILDKAFKGKLV